mmetsp:Transcript_87083/g.224281  ORF Transcript_87083/g.224281 Transcript_87083/m.224281 type:complete len:253 (-) Transcript_87083:985-1743(-)
MSSSGSGAFVVLPPAASCEPCFSFSISASAAADPPFSAAAFSAACAATSARVCARRHSVTLSERGKSLSASCSSFPFGDSIAAFQRMCAGTLFWSPLDLKRRRRCLTNNACVCTSPVSTPSASAAPASSCGSLGWDIPVGFHRRSIMVLWSQRSGSPSSKPSAPSGISKSPSCTGCSMMSQRATKAQSKHVTQAPRRMVSRCLPGNALSVSLLTTRSGSSRSTRMSRQPSNQTAAKRAARRAASAQRCQVLR